MTPFSKPFADTVAPIGKPYTVSPHSGLSGWTDVVERRMSVPSSDKQPHLARIIRTHELLHARHSAPIRTKSDRMWQCLQWAEDWRIAMIGRRTGVQATLCQDTDSCAECREQVPATRRSLFARLESLGCSASESGTEIVLAIIVADRDDDTVVSLTHDLCRRISRAKPLPRYFRRKAAKTLAERLHRILFDDTAKTGLGKGRNDRATGDGEPNWGSMDVSESALDKAQPTLRRYRVTDTGSVPTALHRMALDGQVFRRRRRDRVASVLIDGSGSMSWSQTDLQDVIAQCPAAIVAVYVAESDHGTLHILARDGMIGSVPDIGGCNVIDGPALDWLATQPEPRYWVSDGVVTEVDDRATDRATIDAIGKCVRGRITRVDNAEALVAALSTIRR